MFFYPFYYPALMLVVESNNVIDIRLRKMATGGIDPAIETGRMITEKVEAAVEATFMLLKGGNSADVIDFYRKQVASNAKRLAQ
jgi:hypothetical protein